MTRLSTNPKQPCVSADLFHRKIGNENISTTNPFKDSTVKKKLHVLIVAMVMPLLGGCFGRGTSADPPANFSATEGDGRVILTWTPVPSVEYWLFTSTSPSLSAFNWTSLPYARAYINAGTPFYMCGLFSGTQYYFAANGRSNGGPGGTSSPTITTPNPPYNAIINVAWAPGSTTPTTTSAFLGVGYTGLTTCSNNPISAAGSFAAVGAGGTIFTSSDGKTWAQQTPPTGFTDNLNAVTGYAAYQNNPGNPGLRWVAVGDGGTSIYSTDGITWTAGSTATANPSNYALRAITQVNGTFFAVGDAGTIISSTDGNTWYAHTATSGTTNNLNGVTHGIYFVAVGDNGTIVTSGDGNTWATPASAASLTTSNLQKVAAYGSIIVAVGDGGTIVTSKDNGANWIAQTLTGSPALVGVTAESQVVENAITDPQLGYISTAQFVAVDSAGNTYTSQNGFDWSAGNTTGIATNALVSSGFGYVAVGSGGATAYVF